MTKFRPGTIVRLKRNKKYVGTVISTIRGPMTNSPYYSVWWFHGTKLFHQFTENELELYTK